jgi:hypothetical protein
LVGTPFTGDQAGNIALHAAMSHGLATQTREGIENAIHNIPRMRSLYRYACSLLDEWDGIFEGMTNQIMARILDLSEPGRDF